MKKITVLLSAIIALAALSGCAQNERAVEVIGFDAAKAAATQAAGVNAADARFEESELKEFDGKQYYSIDFYANGREYEYRIDAFTGTVISAPGNPPAVVNSEGNEISGTPLAPATSEQTEKIGEEKAKEIALNHAGLNAGDVTFVKVGIDHDDGRQMYDIEFYTADNREFDYDIDLFSGEILSYDHDAEYYWAGNQADTATISEAEAKAIALAQVPGATEADIREFEVDHDDGRLEYEGAIYFGEIEYEFEIDGHSGAIRSWEAESIYD